MKKFALFISTVIVGVGLTAFAQAEDLQIPSDPIQPHSPNLLACKTYGFLEGADDCSTLELLGEPPEPVTQKDTKLAFRLTWGKGDARNEAIVLRVEIQSTTYAFLVIHQEGNSHVFLDGRAPLSTDDIATLVHASEKAQFWVQPKVKAPPPVSTVNGVEQVLICYDSFSLAGMRSSDLQVLSRSCPMQNKADPTVSMARVFLKVARKHFPDLAAEKDFWGDVI